MSWKSTILVLLPFAFSSNAAQQGGGGGPVPTLAKLEKKKDSALEAITLKRFQSLSLDEGREVFQRLSPVTQTRLWRSKLAKVLASSQLDERQIGVIAMVDGVLAPDLYVGTRAASTSFLLDDLEAEARAAFSPEQFDSIFMFLGPQAGVPVGSFHSGSFYARAATMASLAPDCYCNTWSDYCGGGRTCRRGGCNVDPSGTGVGCGFVWAYICNGRCRR